MDARDNFRPLSCCWRGLAALLLSGVALAAAAAWITPPQYRAAAALLIARPVTGGALARAPQGDDAPALAHARSCAALASNPVVTAEVVGLLGLGMTPSQLAREVTVDTSADRSLLRVTVTDHRRRRVAAIADAVADRLALACSPAPHAGDGHALGPGLVVTPATTPPAPASRRANVDLVGGALIGLALGPGLLVTLRSVSTLADAAGATVTLAGALPRRATGSAGRARTGALLDAPAPRTVPGSPAAVVVLTGVLDNPLRLPRMQSVLAGLAEDFERVKVDTRPAPPAAKAAPLRPTVVGYLLAAPADRQPTTGPALPARRVGEDGATAGPGAAGLDPPPRAASTAPSVATRPARHLAASANRLILAILRNGQTT